MSRVWLSLRSAAAAQMLLGVGPEGSFRGRFKPGEETRDGGFVDLSGLLFLWPFKRNIKVRIVGVFSTLLWCK